MSIKTRKKKVQWEAGDTIKMQVNGEGEIVKIQLNEEEELVARVPKVTAGKKKRRSGRSQNDDRIITTDAFITGSIIRIFIAITLGAFVGGFMASSEEFGSDVLRRAEAGVAYAILITIHSTTGLPLWLAFPKSDSDKLVNALPYIHSIMPVWYLVLMLCWQSVYIPLLRPWQRGLRIVRNP